MSVLRMRVSLVWIFLMAITCVSTWGLSREGNFTAAATVAIFLIAALKVRLVLGHFMELRGAPAPWRLLFEGWVIVVTAAITGIYLQAPAVH